ncbi:MAG: phosphoribosylaminoimidazolesuccinocarboxamide synthase, partial [Methyloligellaceae bacterium]
FWFDRTAELCPNYVVAVPDPNVIIGRRLDMLPIEIVVRDYLTGSTETSVWPMYARGERHVYGHQLPDGLVKNAKLPETIITPTTKGTAGAHDAPTTAEEIVAGGVLSPAQWDDISAKSLALFARGREIAAGNGLILVDTKFEFGTDETGTIVIADEILTPDSSRYWIAESYDGRMGRDEEPESLDKEFLRLWIAARCDPYREPVPEIPAETLMAFSGKYVELYERVTGRRFERPAAGVSVRDRVHAALARALPEFF